MSDISIPLRSSMRPSPRLRDMLGQAWQELAAAVKDTYRPELYYMRGPGPKWRAKHTGGADSGEFRHFI